MGRIKSKINPVILKWWREQLNLDIVFVAEKLGQKTEILEAWENGDSAPTMRQLESIANVYKTHLTVFYLAEPPEKFKPTINYRGIDFRIDAETRYKLEMHITEAFQRKIIATDLYNSLGLVPQDFPRINRNIGVEGVANAIRDFLGDKSRINSMTFSGKNGYEVLRHWRECIESKDILVSQTSSMNTHLGISTDVMRGFCIVGEGIPVIMINSKDGLRGRVFTILHELTHILIGGTSEIQNVDFRNLDDPNLDPEEVFCNKVAAEILVPRANFSEIINSSDFTLSSEKIWKIAKGYGVSEEVIMRRLLDSNKISKTKYEEFRAENRARWAEKVSDGGFAPVKYRVLGANGRLFTQLTLLAYQREKINLLNVAQFLNTSLNHLPAIESALYS